MKFFDDGKPIKLLNVTCCYCGKKFQDNKTKEHVIGRKFVPIGSFSTCWNMILNACFDCNNRKSSIEAEVSAVVMQPDAYGIFPVKDRGYLNASEKKKSTKVQGTNKSVGDSKISSRLIHNDAERGLRIKVDYIAPPQLNEKSAYTLALYQCRAIYYYLTYNMAEKKGHFWRGEFLPLQHVMRKDWGNSFQEKFASFTELWEPRFIGNTANDFFKVAIRKHPSKKLWSWVFEWNMNCRVLGFFGEFDKKDIVVPDPKKSLELEVESYTHDFFKI